MRYDCVYTSNGLLPSEGPSPVVCVSRLFQRLSFVLAATIFAALGLGFALGEFGMFGVHAEQDGAYRQMHVYAEVEEGSERLRDRPKH